jgi:succinyl-CoA synthetase beta subunit
MKLYEYQAKELFHFWHIPVPSGWVCADEEQVRRACARLGREKEIVLKSQVRAGGRGKAGGIRICSTTDEAVAALTELQNMKIKGLQVAKVLVEEKVEIKNEYYVGITIGRNDRGGMPRSPVSPDH